MTDAELRAAYERELAALALEAADYRERLRELQRDLDEVNARMDAAAERIRALTPRADAPAPATPTPPRIESFEDLARKPNRKDDGR